MKKALAICLLTMQLSADPWLGNWLEFEGILSQKHTESRKVDTSRGVKDKKLYQEKTCAAIAFMPDPDISATFILDLAKTQKKSYGFDSLHAACQYRVLNDLVSDPVTLTLGLESALSTPSRVKDLSSNQHGVLDTKVSAYFGREFIIHKGNYYKPWALLYSGISSSGSPWIGFEAHIGKVFAHATQNVDLFFRSEKGLSSRKLGKISHFHSYSRIGYEYEEIGASYGYKEVGLGSLSLEGSYRLHARYAPNHTWSLSLTLQIPFSPW